MSKVVTTNVIPDDASNDLLTIGAASDSVAVNDSLNVDTLQDMGGNTIFVSDGSGTITSKNSSFPGALKLLSTANPSGATNVSFTSGLDSTYDVYCFKCIDLFPSVATQPFTFQVNASGGSGFNETMTTTFFDADHSEAGVGSLQYETGDDQAQGTSYQYLTRATGGDADAIAVGELYLFNPSSTTFVKHFYSRFVEYFSSSPRILDNYVGGYINTTSAITEIDFKFNSGNVTGTIKMYGISKS